MYMWVVFHSKMLPFASMKVHDFGDDFWWGVATSAAQIEGAAFEDGRTASIWDVFAEKKGKIKDRSTPRYACDFYHRYLDDIQLCASLGFKFFRFSISWSRVLPLGMGEPNRAGILFYQKVIDACLAQGMIPMVTLYHWDLPQILQESGGWAGHEVLNAFRAFATLCAQNFGDRVKHWLVMNEPFGFTSLGYLLGIHAPGNRSLPEFFQAVHHVALAQAEGGRILRHYVADAQIGTAYSCSPVYPFQQTDLDQKAAQRIDALVNRLFIEPALGMGFPTVEGWDLLEKFKINYSTWRFETQYQFDFDFVGLQNYFPLVIKHQAFMPWIQAWEVKAKDRGVPQTAMGWEINTDTFVHIVEQFAQYKQVKKWIISEHGAYFKDQLNVDKVQDIQRVAYFESHLEALLQAKRKGMPIDGYLVWTLIDNFEWAEGNAARFGIVYNDFETQKRIIKASGYWWQNFLHT